jgi:hypothetical protein
MRWFVVLTVIAVGLALGLPPDPQSVKELHTTETAYRLAIAVLLIPYILIWYASFYAYAKLSEYSRPLKRSKDGLGFHKITLGMGLLAFVLVIPTIISLILGIFAAHNPDFKTAATVINNYLGLFPGLLAFVILYNGARALVRTVSGATRKGDIRWSAPWFLLLSVVFSHLVIENQYRHHSYHLNLWVLIITFIVPFLYAWMVGLLCAYDLRLYADSVKGLLYKRGIRQFANGIAITIVGSIAIQFVNIALTERLKNTLGFVLLIDYLLLAIVLVGLMFMAFGTKKLKRLEEV